MNRVAEVNKALKALGAAERLRRGEGYYYFTEGNAPSWPTAGVYGVYRAIDLTVTEWMDEYRRLKGEFDKRTAVGVY